MISCGHSRTSRFHFTHMAQTAIILCRNEDLGRGVCWNAFSQITEVWRKKSCPVNLLPLPPLLVWERSAGGKAKSPHSGALALLLIWGLWGCPWRPPYLALWAQWFLTFSIPQFCLSHPQINPLFVKKRKLTNRSNHARNSLDPIELILFIRNKTMMSLFCSK